MAEENDDGGGGAEEVEEEEICEEGAPGWVVTFGDMMSLLMKRDVLTEEETRFYAAQVS